MLKEGLAISFAFMIILCLNTSSIFGSQIHINITENSSLIKLVDGRYSLKANGVLLIRNPSLFSKVYEFEMPYSLDSLIGINKVNGSNQVHFKYNKIEGYIIGLNETLRVNYNIYGILNYDLYKNLAINQSVLDYYIEEYDFRSQSLINLQKPQREGYTFNLNGSINKTPTNNTKRLISSKLRNPTDFNYFIKNLKLYRSSVSDPFFNNGVIIKTYNNISLDKFSSKEINFFDTLSNDSSVYWLSSDIIIKYNKSQVVLRKFSVQKLPSPVSSDSGSTSSSHTSGSGFSSFNLHKNKVSIVVKKSANETIISNGKPFEVMLYVVNNNNFELKNLTLKDIIPEGYEIKSVSNDVKIKDKNLLFNINSIKPYESKSIKYVLVLKDKNIVGITYLNPAKVFYDGEEFFSDGVLIVNDMLPHQKVFIQKEIKYLNNGFAQVKIIVKNLGNYQVENLLVNDQIDDSSVVKDITQMFYKNEKGVWLIRKLKPNSDWQVSYIIEKNANLETLPNIYGIDKSKIFGTILSSGEVVTDIKEEPHTIEKVGMGFAVGFLIVYLLF